MAKVESTPVQPQDFYRAPARDEYYPLAETSEAVLQNSEYRKLVSNCLSSVQLHGITAFHNGETSHPPLHQKTKDAFTQQVTSIVGSTVQDLFRPDGTVAPEHKDEWKTINRIAPRLIEIFTRSTNHLYSINRAQTANLVRFGIDVARDPSLLEDTEINLAIGGSDDEWSTSRLPAYIIPGVSLLRDVKNLYAGLTAAAIAEKTTGKTLSNKDVEDKIAETTEKGLQIPPELSDDDLDWLMRTNGIPTQGPRVLLVSGAPAARAINHAMDSDKIIGRNEENLRIIREYVDEYHADVADRVEIADGLTWPEATNPGEESMSNYTRTVMDYLANTLENAEEPEIKYAVDNLKRRGERRGGEAGRRGSMLYAASHPRYFDDRLNLPFGKFLDRKSKQPRMVISVGGKTEKQFDIARDYLSNTASVEGFQAYLWDVAIPAAENIDVAKELVEFYWASKKWKEMIDDYREREYNPSHQIQTRYEQARSASSFREQFELLDQIDQIRGYVKPPITTRADLPEFGTLQYLLKVGDHATYYAIPEVKGHVYSNGVHEPRIEERMIIVDQPFGNSVGDQLKALRSELAGMQEASKNDKGIKKDNLLPIEVVSGVVHDLEVLEETLVR